MKYILIIGFLLPIFAFSQDCKLIKETDPYTKDTKLSTGFIALNGGSVTFDADSKEIDIFFTIKGNDICFDNNSTAYLLFEGSKTKSSFRNGGTMNCEGLFHFIYKNSTSTTTILKKMATQKIASIVFIGNNKKESTISVKPEMQEAVMTLANCLINEAKTLIK